MSVSLLGKWFGRVASSKIKKLPCVFAVLFFVTEIVMSCWTIIGTVCINHEITFVENLIGSRTATQFRGSVTSETDALGRQGPLFHCLAVHENIAIADEVTNRNVTAIRHYHLKPSTLVLVGYQPYSGYVEKWSGGGESALSYSSHPLGRLCLRIGRNCQIVGVSDLFSQFAQLLPVQINQFIGLLTTGFHFLELPVDSLPLPIAHHEHAEREM